MTFAANGAPHMISIGEPLYRVQLPEKTARMPVPGKTLYSHL
jgi:hypothetical protein